ncbi:MAG: DUF4432 family protein [Lachnospiraceae bacterium]|nr:DUF4432 family protein [Lachnospiraceae bacterium]
MERKTVKDRFGRELNIYKVSGGRLSFTFIPERGMDVGEIFVDGNKMSWERTEEALLHPDSVDLKAEGGWDAGFYCAVASLGPEVFGTPDEVRTVHGTGAYSPADPESVKYLEDDEKITVSASLYIKGYDKKPEYKKTVRYITYKSGTFLYREDLIENLTDKTLPLDDGYHVQLGGSFLKEGGRYLLPVRKSRMFLRDSAPAEEDPCMILPFDQKLDPIRCYQYIPERVEADYGIKSLQPYKDLTDQYKNVTMEMLINKEKDMGAVLLRELDIFPRSLIAKRNITEPMYSIEPCKTRPNSVRQNAIDGELQYIGPGECKKSSILLGYVSDRWELSLLEDAVTGAAGRFDGGIKG